jgi:AcrR family transcriptional regulator
MVDNATTGPSLRERRRQETAELITDAVLTLMAEAGIDGLTMEAVAERVGVSLRTVYRYFPDRASLLAAALARHNESVPFESPTSPDQIGATYGEVFARFDDAPAIVQAVLAARVAGSVRWDARSQRIRDIEEALASACDRLPPEEAAQATAVIVYLANALAWLSLRDESGLDGHQSGAAITWAIDTLVADLRRRNQRARARA